MIHGLLLLDKPKDWTSHDLVARVRSLLNTSEVGHCGTLDPLATGLMVILVGEATKISQYILDGDKTYLVRVRLGITTDTLDVTGHKLSECPVSKSRAEILSAMQELTGEQELKVPVYSAVKIKGEKLYQKARRNEFVEPPLKKMIFYHAELIESGADWMDVELKCSKGSYVRSWAQAIGDRLGCGAVVEELRRTFSAPYRIEDAISIEELEQAKGDIKKGHIPLPESLPRWLTVRVFGPDQKHILNGQITPELRHKIIANFKMDAHEGVKVTSQTSGLLLALIGFEKEQGFKLRRVFRY